MAKKSANYSTYELRVEDGGKIVILNSGELVPSAMAAIRTIAAEVGFEIDSKWNTQSAGRKLVDFLNSSAPAAAPAAKEATASHVDSEEAVAAAPAKPVKKPGGLPEDYRPSESELKRYLDTWDGLGDYVDNEKALSMIFREDPIFSQNTDMRCVIIKCSALNDFYSTNIYRIAPVARKIVEIEDFDERLKQGDDSLVEEIALVEGRRNYSFATKYCSHHQPLLYPIFDRYVCDVLAELRKRNPGSFRFKSKKELTEFATFKGAIDDFAKAYGLDSYSYKDIDRYLWQLGKDFYNPYDK